MSEWLWTWDGTSFGYRDGDSLFTHNGVEAGRFHCGEIYGADGAYIGELKSGKLVTNTSKKSQHKSSFTARRSVAVVDRVGRVGTVGFVGYDDFPNPESFQ
jgi:hypothetical protein